MPTHSRRRLIAIVAVILILLALLFLRCQRSMPVVAPPVTSAPAQTAVAPPEAAAPGQPPAVEVLSAATLAFPPQVPAGKSFAVKWTGPNNDKDYVTVVRRDAADATYANYTDTREGSPLQLLAPIEPGDWEVRYVANASKTVLARAPLVVTANAVTFTAPPEVIAGTAVTVVWTGPNNAGDYITLVPKGLPDGQYGNYAYTTKGSPLVVTAPIADGDSELRYMTGQGGQVLGRSPVRVVPAAITLDAPVAAAAGSTVSVKWTGPNNPGDYVTIVPQSLPDGQYAAYAYTEAGSPLSIAAPKSATLGEVRYMSGQGGRVLLRRSIVITP